MKIKNIIYGILLGIFVTIPSITLGQWSGRSVDGSGNSIPVGGYPKAASSNLPNGTISGIILQVMYWLLGLLGIFGVIGFVISGILYLTAAGDDSKMELGKKAMKWSIMGVVVGLIGFVIIKAVNTMLGGSSATF